LLFTVHQFGLMSYLIFLYLSIREEYLKFNSAIGIGSNIISFGFFDFRSFGLVWIYTRILH
jgi:hypothetical protein